MNRYQFYERLKIYAAAPLDVIRCNEKHLREHPVVNCCAVIITTNHKTDGLYLPPDDRRTYATWSPLTLADIPNGYFDEMYNWFDRGGAGHVAAYLSTLGLSDFNPKSPPPKTQAFWEIVNANRAPEDAELADIIDSLESPDVLTIPKIIAKADQDFANWLSDRRNSRQIPHRLESCGYVAVQNPHADDGLWKIGSKRMRVYGKAN